MDTASPCIFTPARIVGLVLIALAVIGLTSVRLASGDDPVSVPAGAKAGDLTLEPCTYATEGGSFEADCGTLVVPENRAEPGSRLIALPVTRIRAQTERPGEPVFSLEGGPGISNMDFPEASRFAHDRDVVLVGYRGVDGSVHLDCPEVRSALRRSRDLVGEGSLRAQGDAYRACADRLTAEGVELRSYGLAQQVEDLEAARKALGYERINLLSESAGTRTAMIYAWRHPRSIHRSVMIGVNPPGNFLIDPEATDEQLGRYAELCSIDAGCSGRTGDLAATMKAAAADLPSRWLFLPIQEGTVRVTSLIGLSESTSEAFPIDGPMVLDAWLSAEEGDPSGLWFLSVFGDLLLPELFVHGQYAAAARVDAEAARAYFASRGEERASNLGHAGSAFAWGGGSMVDGWPAAPDEREYGRVRTSAVETLLIGGELDFMTPPQLATRELLPSLPNGHQVVLPEVGHISSFYAVQPQAGTHLITTFLASGRVDDSLYRPGKVVDFTPGMTLTTIARLVAGTMVGLALLTVLSLAWIALRLRRRSHFGPKASGALRSVYALVAGLGGLLLGMLIALTALPTVPVTDELLVTLSVGVPVGLALHLGWVDLGWSGGTRWIGFAAAAGGAVIGAWLGFNAVDPGLASLTAIPGAVAAGNLLVVALDVAWDRQGRERLVVTHAGEAPAALPSAG